MTPDEAEALIHKERVCAINDCTRPSRSRGWCKMHYSRWLRTGDATKVRKPGHPPLKPCTIEGCHQPHSARGYCHTHYKRWQTHGDPLKVLPLGGGPRDAIPSYYAMHARLQRHYKVGRCSNIKCSNTPTQMALIHGRDAHTSYYRGRALRYSIDPKNYIELCTKCHHDYDEVEKATAVLRRCAPERLCDEYK